MDSVILRPMRVNPMAMRVKHEAQSAYLHSKDLNSRGPRLHETMLLQPAVHGRIGLRFTRSGKRALQCNGRRCFDRCIDRGFRNQPSGRMFRCMSMSFASLSNGTAAAGSAVSLAEEDLPLNPSGRQVQVEQRGEEWLQKRMNVISASDAANALGMFTSATVDTMNELFREKVTRVSAFSGNQYTAHGNAYEAYALKEFEALTGYFVEAGNFYEQDAPNGYLGVSPDGFVNFRSGRGVLEVKCPSKSGGLFEPELVEPATRLHTSYFVQIQQQLAVTGLDFAAFFSWTLNKGAVLIQVQRDQEFWDLLSPLLREFWHCVLRGREAYAQGLDFMQHRCAFALLFYSLAHPFFCFFDK